MILRRISAVNRSFSRVMHSSSSLSPALMDDTEAARRKKVIDVKYSAWRPRWPAIRTIKAQQLWEKLQSERNDWILVDIRTKEEQDVSMLPGALSQQEFESSLDQVKGNNKKIVAYCTAGYRSGEYAASLVSGEHKLDGSRVYNLEGSLLSWTHESLPLVSIVNGKEVETKMVHVFSPSWSLEGPGYTPVLFDKPLMGFLLAFMAMILYAVKDFVKTFLIWIGQGGGTSKKPESGRQKN
jgi:rhodanese-related sulfurtransferase